jgi:hypothetical protein
MCPDCLLDIRHNPPAHNGILYVLSCDLSGRVTITDLINSGEGSEQENLQKEKAFEAAAAKGYRPCNEPSLLFVSNYISNQGFC